MKHGAGAAESFDAESFTHVNEGPLRISLIVPPWNT